MTKIMFNNSDTEVDSAYINNKLPYDQHASVLSYLNVFRDISHEFQEMRA